LRTNRSISQPTVQGDEPNSDFPRGRRRAVSSVPHITQRSRFFIMRVPISYRRKAVEDYQTRACEQISLQGEKWIVPVDDCRLTLQWGDGDFGVRRVGPLSFECELTVDGWRSVVSLLEQFCNSKTKRFQWWTRLGLPACYELAGTRRI